MFLPLPEYARHKLGGPANVSPAALPPPPRKPEPMLPFYPRRRDPARDVHLMPAVSTGQVREWWANKHAQAAPKVVGLPDRAWYEDPIALGSLLILLPPIGLATLWTSKRYSTDARWALTVMTALMMCLGAVVVVVIMSMAR